MALYIRFVKSKSLAEKIIRLFTVSNYSHVDFYDSDTNEIFGSFSDSGVSEFRINPESAEYLIKIPDKYSSQIRNEFNKYRGLPYDWTAISAFVFSRDWQKSDSWFCSELVAKILHDLKLIIVTEEYSRVTPGDLLDLLIKQKVSLE